MLRVVLDVLDSINCFGEVNMTPYVSRSLILTFTNVVNGVNFKFR